MMFAVLLDAIKHVGLATAMSPCGTTRKCLNRPLTSAIGGTAENICSA